MVGRVLVVLNMHAWKRSYKIIRKLQFALSNVNQFSLIYWRLLTTLKITETTCILLTILEITETTVRIRYELRSERIWKYSVQGSPASTSFITLVAQAGVSDERVWAAVSNSTLSSLSSAKVHPKISDSVPAGHTAFLRELVSAGSVKHSQSVLRPCSDVVA